MGFPGGASGEESACQCRKFKACGSHPWAGKTPWSRKWKPAPVFLPGKNHGQRIPAGGRRKLDMPERPSTNIFTIVYIIYQKYYHFNMQSI